MGEFIRILVVKRRSFSCIWKYAWAAAKPTSQPPNPVHINVGADHETETNHGNLFLLEVENEINGFDNNFGADKIGGVFEEEEPSLEENLNNNHIVI